MSSLSLRERAGVRVPWIDCCYHVQKLPPLNPLREHSNLSNMQSTKSASPYHGIVTPLVTPLAGRDKLDHAGLERLIEHELSGGVHGLFLLGTTGEASALSGSLRRELISVAIRQVNRRVPILVGVSDT